MPHRNKKKWWVDIFKCNQTIWLTCCRLIVPLTCTAGVRSGGHRRVHANISSVGLLVQAWLSSRDSDGSLLYYTVYWHRYSWCLQRSIHLYVSEDRRHHVVATGWCADRPATEGRHLHLWGYIPVSSQENQGAQRLYRFVTESFGIHGNLHVIW